MEPDERIETQELSLLRRSVWFSVFACVLVLVFVAGKEISCAQSKTPYLPGWRPWHPIAFVIPQYLIFAVWGLILILRRRGKPVSSYKWSLVGSWVAVPFAVIPYFFGYWDETCRSDYVETDGNIHVDVAFGALMATFFATFGSWAGYHLHDSGMFSDEHMLAVLILVLGLLIALGYVFREQLLPIIFFWLIFFLA